MTVAVVTVVLVTSFKKNRLTPHQPMTCSLAAFRDSHNVYMRSMNLFSCASRIWNGESLWYWIVTVCRPPTIYHWSHSRIYTKISTRSKLTLINNNLGWFINHVSDQKGGGHCWHWLSKQGEGVWQKLTLAEKGGT